MSRYTRRLSAAISNAATASPRASGGVIGRNTNDKTRARIGACPTCASEVPRAKVPPCIQPGSRDSFCVIRQAHIGRGGLARAPTCSITGASNQRPSELSRGKAGVHVGESERQNFVGASSVSRASMPKPCSGGRCWLVRTGRACPARLAFDARAAPHARLLRCGQRGDNAADNLPVQEHPVVANAADRYGLDFGVGRHRPETRHDYVGRGRECQPPHAVG